MTLSVSEESVFMGHPTVHCTVVNKGVIIEILDFELGAFSENLRLIMTWRKGIFGLSLQKKKF